MNAKSVFSPCEMRTTLLTINSYENKSMKGSLKNPFFGVERKFSGTLSFLLMLEKLLDSLDSPTYTGENCCVQPENSDAAQPEAAEDEAPYMARFALRILFRQNASWQGTICWLDRKSETQFRSVLELLILMDGALSETMAVPTKRWPSLQFDK